MTHTEIIKLAEQCGIPEFDSNESQADNIVRFANAIWNAAIEKAATEFECDDSYYYDEIRDSILRLKK